jgi:IS30 family transposase
MKRWTKNHYTEADRALMWERWRRGESLSSIARLFDRQHSVIGGILSRSGGIRPRARRRSVRALALTEREEISRGAIAGLSARAIARSLRGAPSTVSREICRNGGRDGYRASEADTAAWDRAKRPKRCRLAQNRALARLVAEKLRLEWSPFQVAGWLKRTYPHDETHQVSHETIYRTLFIQARGP